MVQMPLKRGQLDRIQTNLEVRVDREGAVSQACSQAYGIKKYSQ